MIATLGLHQKIYSYKNSTGTCFSKFSRNVRVPAFISINPVFTSSSTSSLLEIDPLISFSLHQLIDSRLLEIDPLISFSLHQLMTPAFCRSIHSWQVGHTLRGRGRILAVTWIRIITIYEKNAFLELNKSVSVATIIKLNRISSNTIVKKKRRWTRITTHASRGALITSAGSFVSL